MCMRALQAPKTILEMKRCEQLQPQPQETPIAQAPTTRRH